MSIILGIDFGTTNSCMAIIENGKPIIIPNSEGNRLTPSIVAFSNEGQILVGDSAKRQALLNPQHTVVSVKKILGRKYFEIEEFTKSVPYHIIRSDKDIVKLRLRNKLYTPQEIAAFVIQKLKIDAESFLRTKVSEAVLTVPSKFGLAQIEALREAGELAGLNVRRIVTESTAACLAYGLFNSKNDVRVYVFDLGGGSLDVSIIESDDGVFEVLSTYGDIDLGGDDFDFAIVKWFLEDYQKNENLDLSTDSRIIYRVKEAAEKAKIELSQSLIANIYVPFISINSTITNLEKPLTRETFRKLSEHLIEKSKVVCNKAITISKRSVLRPAPTSEELIFVGGSTRIPFIKETISQLFGLKLNNKINPDEVVSIGAAIQGGVLSGDVKDILLLDVTSNSYGIKVFLKNKEVFFP